MFVSRQIKFQFNRESRLIASTWRTSRITRLEKREERKRKIPGSRLIHFSAEITDISFILFLLLLPPPLFFPFSFFFLSSPYETVDTKPSGTKVEARWRMDRSIDRSIGFIGKKKWKLRGPYSRMGIARKPIYPQRKAYGASRRVTSRGELLDTVPSGTKHFSRRPLDTIRNVSTIDTPPPSLPPTSKRLVAF